MVARGHCCVWVSGRGVWLPTSIATVTQGEAEMNRHSVFSSCFLTGVSLLAFAGLLFGQGQDRGVITGLVTDKTGRLLPGIVTVTNVATGDKIPLKHHHRAITPRRR